MLDFIKLRYQKNFVWLYPLRYIFLAIIISFLAIYFDTSLQDTHSYIPSFLLSSKDLSQTILTTLVSAIITITTFTFSTTMVVLTMYSSQFSPRVVSNFLSEKITLRVLGIFIGGFFYSLISLMFMKSQENNASYISASIGVIYGIICLIYFALFIFHVSSSVQANNLIAKLYSQASESIHTAIDNHEEYTIEKSDLDYDSIYKYSYTLPSQLNGYVQSINYDMILDSCNFSNSTIKLRTKNGDFVVLGQPLAEIFTSEVVTTDDIRDLEEVINKATVIDTYRDITYDYMYSVLKIVDIALRAISPGINDPNTAIECINILGILLSKMSKESNNKCKRTNKDTNSSVVYDYFEFKNDIYLTFYQILHYGKEDISVVLAILNALKNMSYYASAHNKEVLRDFIEYVKDNVLENFSSELDKERIREINIL